MPSDAAPRDELKHPETGEPVDLDKLKFVSLVGNLLTLYFRSEMEWYKSVNGERRAREIGDFSVTFRNGMYPPGGETIDYKAAKLMLNDERLGDLYAIAADEQEVAPGEEVETPPEPEPELAENEVRIDGQILTKEQALSYLSDNEGAEMDAPPEDEIDAPASAGEAETPDYTVLSEPNNRTEALEALANAGVDMSEAPSASATTDEIQAFAKEKGYLIERYT